MTDAALTSTRSDTKQRILDAAEMLFAEHGVGATSLRSVIALAGVNLAAIHYHFGSKAELLHAVVARRVDPINEERLRMLDEYDRASREPTLEELVEAFVRPMVRIGFGDRRSGVMNKLIGRLIGEPEFFEKIAPEQFAETRTRFTQAFQRCLPHLPPEEMFWRLMFMIGTATYTLRVADYLPNLSEGVCGEVSAEVASKRMVAFMVAGLRAGSAGE